MATGGGGAVPGRRDRSLFWLTLAALLWTAACGGPSPKTAERRILFCDDLRVHSVRPDGTGALEFPGKNSTSPWPVRMPLGVWRVLIGSYRGPYLFLDAPKPGLYACSPAGSARRRIADLPEMPVIVGLASEGSRAVFFGPGTAETLQIVDTWTGSLKAISLPARLRAAAVDPKGERVAVALEPRMRTVVLGNQAWFSEGSDLILVELASGKAETIPFPNLPDPLGAEPKLESYAGGGMSAVAWIGSDTLLVSSAPGLWTLKLAEEPTASHLAKTRIPGSPPADGLAVARAAAAAALTCGGKLFVWDVKTGALRDITPPGLIGGAHHPVWLEP